MGGCVGSRPNATASNDERLLSSRHTSKSDNLTNLENEGLAVQEERRRLVKEIQHWESSKDGLISLSNSSLGAFALDLTPQEVTSPIDMFGMSANEICDVASFLINHIDLFLEPILSSTLDKLTAESEHLSEEITTTEVTTAARQMVEKSLNLSSSTFAKSIRCALELLYILLTGQSCSRQFRAGKLSVIHPDILNAGYDVKKCCIASINHLLEAVNISLVQPSAGLLSQRQLEEGLVSLLDLCLFFGVVPDAVCIPASLPEQTAPWLHSLPLLCLTACTKSLLVYVSTQFNQHRVSLNPLVRHRVIKDTLHLMKMQSLWNGVPISLFIGNATDRTAKYGDASTHHYRLFPVFTRRGGSTVEHGEGHGPRKEFYDLATSLLIDSYTPDDNMGDMYSVTAVEGERKITVTRELEPEEGIPTTDIESIPPWTIIIVSHSSNVFESELIEKPKVMGNGTYQLKLSKPSPFSGSSLPFVVRWRNPSLFQSQLGTASDATWFREADPSLGTTTKPNSEQLSILDEFAFAGFLLGQSISNGVSMNLGLPPLFYKLLVSWPDYTPCLDDIKLLSSSLHQSLTAILVMSDEDFDSLLSLEDASGLTRSQYVDQKINSIAGEGIANQMSAFVWGFSRTGLHKNRIFQSCTPHELQLIVQGRADDGVRDFCLHDEYRVIETEELSKLEYNKRFSALLWESVDNGFGAEPQDVASRKRKFLKFLTGRSNLPPHPKQENIYVVLPYTVFSAHSFDEYFYRLPVSHTCDNTLELPNYMESLIFGKSSPWYQQAGVAVGATITEEMKRNCWDQLTEKQQEDICVRLKANLDNRFNIAIQNAGSYELDFIEDSTQEQSIVPVTTGITTGEEEHEMKPAEEPKDTPHLNRDDWDDDSPRARGGVSTQRTSITRHPNPTTVVHSLLNPDPSPRAVCAPEKAQFINISAGGQPDLAQPEYDTNCDPWGTEDLDELLEQFR